LAVDLSNGHPDKWRPRRVAAMQPATAACCSAIPVGALAPVVLPQDRTVEMRCTDLWCLTRPPNPYRIAPNFSYSLGAWRPQHAGAETLPDWQGAYSCR